jgi:hypothetical protein
MLLRAGLFVLLLPAADLLLAAVHATRSAAEAVQMVYTVAGGTANYRRSALQRALRDVHGVTQHIGTAPQQYEDAGRMVLGVGGYVEGDVVAREVLLCGRFEGRIFAFNVTIAPSAVLKGRVFHHTITVAKEAQIEGRMPWRPINFFETLGELPKEI